MFDSNFLFYFTVLLRFYFSIQRLIEQKSSQDTNSYTIKTILFNVAMIITNIVRDDCSLFNNLFMIIVLHYHMLYLIMHRIIDMSHLVIKL